MRRMKRLLAGVATVAVLCGSVSVMGTSAVVRDKDVNNDGSIDILDVIMLNQYLAGQFYVSNPAEMDANGNLIVDIVDSQCILAYTVNAVCTWRYVDVTA